jgi:hypothetical protein
MTFLDAMRDHDIDQADARAATAEQERDDALDDRDQQRTRAEKAERERDSLARRLGVRFQELEQARTERDEWEQTAGQLAKQLDEMREARDVLRHRLDQLAAENARLRQQRAELAEKLEHAASIRIDAHGVIWHAAPDGHWHHRIYGTRTLERVNEVFGKSRPALLIELDDEQDEPSGCPTLDGILTGQIQAIHDSSSCARCAVASVPDTRAQGTDWSHEIAFADDGSWAIGHPDGCPGRAFGDCDVQRLAAEQVDATPVLGVAGHRYRCAVGDLGDRFLLGDRIGGQEPVAPDGCGTCWACRAAKLDDPAARVVRAALDWRAGLAGLDEGVPAWLTELVEAVDQLLAAPPSRRRADR